MLRTFFLSSVFALLLATTASAGERIAGPFETSVDPSLYERPALTLTNPHDRSIEVEVTAASSVVETRRAFTLELEAGGVSTVSLDGAVTFDQLTVRSEQRFDARIESLASGERVQLRLGGSTLFDCNGTWTLTCDWPSCNLGPFSATGYVRPGGRVYWNLNYPTGTPWETENNQGLTAVWSGIDGDNCPSTVTNSLGDTYSIDVELFPEIGPW